MKAAAARLLPASPRSKPTHPPQSKAPVQLLPEGDVKVTDEAERDLYDRLIDVLSIRHPDADLSWSMGRCDKQDEYLGISDDETGEQFYFLQPWKSESTDQDWEMLYYHRHRVEARILHWYSLKSLALLAIEHFMPRLPC